MTTDTQDPAIPAETWEALIAARLALEEVKDAMKGSFNAGVAYEVAAAAENAVFGVCNVASAYFDDPAAKEAMEEFKRRQSERLRARREARQGAS